LYESRVGDLELNANRGGRITLSKNELDVLRIGNEAVSTLPMGLLNSHQAVEIRKKIAKLTILKSAFFTPTLKSKTKMVFKPFVVLPFRIVDPSGFNTGLCWALQRRAGDDYLKLFFSTIESLLE
jgi:hypothetical protein